MTDSQLLQLLIAERDPVQWGKGRTYPHEARRKAKTPPTPLPPRKENQSPVETKLESLIQQIDERLRKVGVM